MPSSRSSSKEHSSSRKGSNKIMPEPPLTRIEEHPPDRPRARFGWRDICCLTVLSSTTLGAAKWGLMLHNGFVPALIALGLASAAYLAVVYCLSELVSAIPFSGGAYGFVRVTMGRNWSLAVGLAEVLQYVMQGGLLCAYVGRALGHMLQSSRAIEVGFLAGAMTLVTMSTLGLQGSVQLRMKIGVIVMSLILAYYVFSCVASGLSDLATYASYHSSDGTIQSYKSVGDPISYAKMTRFAVMLLLGTELVPLAAEDSVDPRKSLPKGMQRGLAYSVVAAFLTVVVGSSMPPGINMLQTEQFPMTVGFQAVHHTTSAIYNLLALPGLLITLETTAFAYSRVIYSLARANLLPSAFTRLSRRHVPYNGLLLGGLLAFLVSALLQWDDQGDGDDHGVYHLFVCDVIMVTGFIHLGFILAAFVLLRVKCPAIPRFFISPLGFAGAAFAGIIVLVAFAGCWLANEKFWVAVVACFVCYLAGGSYYLLYARRRMKLSSEEMFALASRVTAAKMLSTGVGYSYLYKQCALEFSTENITCWQAIDEYRKDPTIETYVDIYTTYLSLGAPQQANVPAVMFGAAMDAYKKLNAALQEALKAPQQLMAMFEGAAPVKDTESLVNTLRQFKMPKHSIAIADDMSVANVTVVGSSEATPRQEVSKMPLVLRKEEYTPAVRKALEDTCRVLEAVQREVLLLLEKDTLPRFKSSHLFKEYLEAEPLMFQGEGLG